MGYNCIFIVIYNTDKKNYVDKLVDVQIPQFIQYYLDFPNHYTLCDYLIQVYNKNGGKKKSSNINMVITREILLQLIKNITYNRGIFKTDYLDTVNDDGIDTFDVYSGTENKTKILLQLYKLLDEINKDEIIVYTGSSN